MVSIFRNTVSRTRWAGGCTCEFQCDLNLSQTSKVSNPGGSWKLNEVGREVFRLVGWCTPAKHKPNSLKWSQMNLTGLCAVLLLENFFLLTSLVFWLTPESEWLRWNKDSNLFHPWQVWHCNSFKQRCPNWYLDNFKCIIEVVLDYFCTSSKLNYGIKS